MKDDNTILAHMNSRFIAKMACGAAIVAASLASTTALGLSFERLGGTMVAHGEIKPGDYQRFVDAYREWDAPPRIYAFDSAGGSVYEAIAIANFVRLSRIPVWVTGKCYSSCALIYLSAATRQASGEIGLHRAYYNPEYYSQLTSLDAQQGFEYLQTVTEVFLRDMRVSTDVIELIQGTPSNEVAVFQGRPETSEMFGEESPYMEEWYISKCGGIEREAAAAWCAKTVIETIQVNSALVDGWRERFNQDRVGMATDHLPGFCNAVLSDSFELVRLATENHDGLPMLERRAQPLEERFQCVSDAEDEEVWAFFNTITQSEEAYDLFNVPAPEFVMRKYGF